MTEFYLATLFIFSLVALGYAYSVIFFPSKSENKSHSKFICEDHPRKISEEGFPYAPSHTEIARALQKRKREIDRAALETAIELYSRDFEVGDLVSFGNYYCSLHVKDHQSVFDEAFQVHRRHLLLEVGQMGIVSEVSRNESYGNILIRVEVLDFGEVRTPAWLWGIISKCKHT